MRFLKPKQAPAELERFCRQCGSPIEAKRPAKDPDELTGNGIGAVIVGDGLLMVAVILSATQTAVSSLLWLLLLIPAFFFFGKGFGDVLHARQIRRRLKHESLDHPTQLHSTSEGPVGQLLKTFSGELAALPSVTDRTTRNLE